MMGSQTEHVGIITSIDIFNPEKTKSVSVSNDYCIKIWDMGAADLTSILSMRNAHFGSITGVSTSKSDEACFVTCSRDKSTLHWDFRAQRPATGLYENHTCGFSTVYWGSNDENNQQVLVGDDLGDIHVIDLRKPNEFLSSINVFDKPIHKINVNG